MEQLVGMGQGRLQIGQPLHLLPGHTVDQRQVVGGIGEGHGRVRPHFRQGLSEHHIRFMHQGVRAADGACGNVS